jgi:hypothetical protein
MDSLAHYLYSSPVRFSPYLADHSTRAYLSLVDDATSSLSLHVPLERITHHELDRILRGELAVAEWRISFKLARYHQRHDYMSIVRSP